MTTPKTAKTKKGARGKAPKIGEEITAGLRREARASALLRKEIELAADAAAKGAVGVQVYPGSYLLYDASNKAIGAMYCVKSTPTKNFEYYGLNSMVGGAGTPDGTTVFSVVWKDGFFADLQAFKDHCATKGYSTHILATCVTNGWT